MVICLLFLTFSGLTCGLVWTGGWSTTPLNIDSWNWFYCNDFNGKSDPVSADLWPNGQPNNWGGNQYALTLTGATFMVNDIRAAGSGLQDCFLCECP